MSARCIDVHLEVGELSLERDHWVSTVGAANTKRVQDWDGSGNLVSAQESEDTKHSQTSVVDLRD